MRRPIAALLLALAAACSSIAGPSGDVEIRVANVSSMPLENVVVALPDGDHAFGTIAPGAETEYRTVSRAYHYATIRAVAEGEELVLQAVDYVGETLLAPGRYTYVLDLDAGGGGLTQGFRRDD